jgi:polysaccharide export outer membrane protein
MVFISPASRIDTNPNRQRGHLAGDWSWRDDLARRDRKKSSPNRACPGLFWLLCLLATGCQDLHPCDAPPEVPRELRKVSLSPYIIEPPDILNIDAVRLVPKPPYRIDALDALGIQVTNTLPNEPIAGIYTVETDGTVNLGYSYGAVQVLDLTLEEAKVAIQQYLKKKLKPPFEVTVVLAEGRAMQQIRGQHLVNPDGTVHLGVYGSVYVDDLTLAEAKQAIEQHLSHYLLRPEVSVDVSGFNSKVYYVITDGGGFGEQVARLPITGKATVLDAVAQINGLGPVSSRHHIWLARPTPEGPEQIFPIDWNAIARCADTATNYEIFPGDRVYIKADALVTTDTYLARIISPIERMLGVTLLGASTIQQLQNMGRTAGGSSTTTPGGTTVTVTSH